MAITYEQRRWIDDSLYFRVHYAAHPFCRVRDTGHEWEILFAPGKGPKNPGPYYAASLAQAKRWIDCYARYHEHRLIGEQMSTGSYDAEPSKPWLWPEQKCVGKISDTKKDPQPKPGGVERQILAIRQIRTHAAVSNTKHTGKISPSPVVALVSTVSMMDCGQIFSRCRSKASRACSRWRMISLPTRPLTIAAQAVEQL